MANHQSVGRRAKFIFLTFSESSFRNPASSNALNLPLNLFTVFFLKGTYYRTRENNEVKIHIILPRVSKTRKRVQQFKMGRILAKHWRRNVYDQRDTIKFVERLARFLFLLPIALCSRFFLCIISRRNRDSRSRDARPLTTIVDSRSWMKV